MQLRTGTLRTGARRLGALLPRAATPLLVWGVPLAVLEVLGRLSPNDGMDAVGVVCVLALAAAARMHLSSTTRRAWNGPLGRRWAERLSAFDLTLGLDLRRDPPIVRRLPHPYVGVVVVAVAIALVTWATRGLWPSQAREALRGVSGFAYLAYLTALWCALASGTLVAFGGCVHYLREQLPGLRRRFGDEAAARFIGWGVLFVLVPCAVYVPRGATLALALASFLAMACAFAWPSRRPLLLVWRRTGSDDPPACMQASLVSIGMGAVGCSILVVLTVISGGDRLAGSGASETTLTALLGLAFAWCAVATCLAIFLGETASLIGHIRLDPARPMPARVSVVGARTATERRAARRSLWRAGMRADFSRPGRHGSEVRITLSGTAPPPEPPDPFTPLRWPLALPLEALDDQDVHDVLRRRDRVVRRRELRRRLSSLLSEMNAYRHTEGTGTWIAPHLWFVARLSRDTDEPEHVPPTRTFAHAISREARSHLFEVLGALEIDLIFLEDGVGFRRFARVLALVFEHHDIFGPQRFEDERHFGGVPGVRVLVHDCFLEESQRKTSYPEPDYEEVGRARVLHVFRDRGGPGEEDPIDLDRTPEFLPRFELV